MPMGFCSYSAIAWVAPLASGQVADVSYALPDTSRAGLVFGILNALGQIAFAYAGHNVVLEIQATLPSTPEKPSKGPMWRGCLVAYVVVAACYFPVAMVGYWAMGNGVGDNVLLSLGKPVWPIAAARLMVVVHVIGSYQVIQSSSFLCAFLLQKINVYAFGCSYRLPEFCKNLQLLLSSGILKIVVMLSDCCGSNKQFQDKGFQFRVCFWVLIWSSVILSLLSRCWSWDLSSWACFPGADLELAFL